MKANEKKFNNFLFLVTILIAFDFYAPTVWASYTRPTAYVSPLPSDLTHGRLRIYNHTDYPDPLPSFDNDAYDGVVNSAPDIRHSEYYDYWEFYYFAGDVYNGTTPLTASTNEHVWDTDRNATTTCQLAMRVFRPKNWDAEHPKIVMYIHGGGWNDENYRSQDGTHDEWYIDTVLYSDGGTSIASGFSIPPELLESGAVPAYGQDDLTSIVQLLDKGYLVYAPSYRGQDGGSYGNDAECSGEASDTDPRWAVWKASVRDIQQAFYHVVNTLPGFLGTSSIDEHLVDIIGNSAGAHLATVLSTHGLGNTSSTYTWELAHSLHNSDSSTIDPLVADSKDGRFMIRSVVAIGPPVDFSLIHGENCNISGGSFDGTSKLFEGRDFKSSTDMSAIQTYSADANDYVSLTQLPSGSPDSISYTTNTETSNGAQVSDRFLANFSLSGGYSSFCDSGAKIYDDYINNTTYNEDFFIYNALGNFYDPTVTDSPPLKLMAGAADSLVPPEMSIAFCETAASHQSPASSITYVNSSQIGSYNSTSSHSGDPLYVDRFSCGATSNVSLEIVEGLDHGPWKSEVTKDTEQYLTNFIFPVWAWLRSDDSDGDGVVDILDNCINVENPSQADLDNDGYGNACDGDVNNDGVVDAKDMRLIISQYGKWAAVKGLGGFTSMVPVIGTSAEIKQSDFNSWVLQGSSYLPGPSGTHP